MFASNKAQVELIPPSKQINCCIFFLVMKINRRGDRTACVTALNYRNDSMRYAVQNQCYVRYATQINSKMPEHGSIER